MSAEPERAVDQHRSGPFERRSEQFDDAVAHHRYVQSVVPGLGGRPARLVVGGDVVVVWPVVPVGPILLPGVPHAVLFLHAVAVSP